MTSASRHATDLYQRLLPYLVQGIARDADKRAAEEAIAAAGWTHSFGPGTYLGWRHRCGKWVWYTAPFDCDCKD